MLPDVELLVVDVLTDQFAGVADVDVGINLDADWTPTSKPFLLVAWDGSSNFLSIVAAFCPIRVIAFAASTAEAKRLAAIAQGLLCSYTGNEISGFKATGGPLPAQDPDTRVDIATVALRATVRTIPIESA